MSSPLQRLTDAVAKLDEAIDALDPSGLEGSQHTQRGILESLRRKAIRLRTECLTLQIGFTPDPPEHAR